MQPSIPVASELEILSFFSWAYGDKPLRCYSYYSSDFGKIITEQKYMLIPIDERMATRAHAVFDTIYIKRMKLINADKHLTRLIASAHKLQIEVPLPKEKMLEVLLAVSRVAFAQFLKGQGNDSPQQLQSMVFTIRVTVSSGHGDFGISSLSKKPTFYAVVFEPFINYEKEKEGVNEYIVQEVDAGQTIFQGAKSTNYAENAIMANESKVRYEFTEKKGGYQGIKMTKDHILLEASVANVAFVFDNGEFATPRFETVIKGTTVTKCLEKVQQLISEGKLKKISIRDIKLEEAYKAKEMMVLGGDKIVPVLNFNDQPISPQRGPIATILQQWYENTLEQGTPVPFE